MPYVSISIAIVLIYDNEDHKDMVVEEFKELAKTNEYFKKTKEPDCFECVVKKSGKKYASEDEYLYADVYIRYANENHEKKTVLDEFSTESHSYFCKFYYAKYEPNVAYETLEHFLIGAVEQPTLLSSALYEFIRCLEGEVSGLSDRVYGR